MVWLGLSGVWLVKDTEGHERRTGPGARGESVTLGNALLEWLTSSESADTEEVDGESSSRTHVVSSASDGIAEGARFSAFHDNLCTRH